MEYAARPASVGLVFSARLDMSNCSPVRVLWLNDNKSLRVYACCRYEAVENEFVMGI